MTYPKPTHNQDLAQLMKEVSAALDGCSQAGEAGHIYGVLWNELRKSCL